MPAHGLDVRPFDRSLRLLGENRVSLLVCLQRWGRSLSGLLRSQPGRAGPEALGLDP